MYTDRPEVAWKVGYAADPSIETLLDKAVIAQITVRLLDVRIQELENLVDVAHLTRDALAEQYQIK